MALVPGSMEFLDRFIAKWRSRYLLDAHEAVICADRIRFNLIEVTAPLRFTTEVTMRTLPVLAALAASLGLAACTLNTAPQNPPVAVAPAPATVVTPAPTVMTPAPASPTVVIRP